MTRDEYWQAHCTRNPKFKDEDASVEIRVGMLKRLMLEAFDKGAESVKKPASGASFGNIMDELLKASRKGNTSGKTNK